MKKNILHKIIIVVKEYGFSDQYSISILKET